MKYFFKLMFVVGLVAVLSGGALIAQDMDEDRTA